VRWQRCQRTGPWLFPAQGGPDAIRAHPSVGVAENLAGGVTFLPGVRGLLPGPCIDKVLRQVSRDFVARLFDSRPTGGLQVGTGITGITQDRSAPDDLR